MVAGQQYKKIAFIIQARMQSTRLPGKILMPLPIGSDVSLLQRLVSSLKTSSYYDSIVIATSENKENDILEEFAIENDIRYFRGSENDVLSRFISILTTNNYDGAVRFTADNPVVDIHLLDKLIEHHIHLDNDYTNSSGMPVGMNFEIIKSSALVGLQNRELTDEEKEHVTLFLKRNDGFHCGTYPLFTPEKYRSIRVTVDYPSDYLLVSSLFSLHEKYNVPVGIALIEFALEQYPFLFEANQNNYQKRSYTNLAEEIEVGLPLLEMMEFKAIPNLIKKYGRDECV